MYQRLGVHTGLPESGAVINRMTGEPILPARTADQYLARYRPNIWPDIGPISGQILVRGSRR
jgi:hypothetical protein